MSSGLINTYYTGIKAILNRCLCILFRYLKPAWNLDRFKIVTYFEWQFHHLIQFKIWYYISDKPFSLHTNSWLYVSQVVIPHSDRIQYLSWLNYYLIWKNYSFNRFSTQLSDDWAVCIWDIFSIYLLIHLSFSLSFRLRLITFYCIWRLHLDNRIINKVISHRKSTNAIPVQC